MTQRLPLGWSPRATVIDVTSPARPVVVAPEVLRVAQPVAFVVVARTLSRRVMRTP